MILSVVLGGFIGLERELNNHAAGFRTHILVCVGSTAIMLLSVYGFSDFVHSDNVRLDPARLAAQVISGIGFLGAGAIVRTGLSVSGLTTAASIWVVAAIGLSVGAGFYYPAVLITLLVILCLFVLNKLEKHMIKPRRHQQLVIRVSGEADHLSRSAAFFVEQDIQIKNVKILHVAEREQEQYVVDIIFTLKITSLDKLFAAMHNISNGIPDVLSIDIRNMISSPNLHTPTVGAVRASKGVDGR